MAANPYRHGVSTTAVAVVAAIALGGCELGLHEVQKAASDGCEPLQARCPAAIDFAGPGPTNPPRGDLARRRIVAGVENAPYRPCDGIGLVCQARVSGDVLWDQYVLVLAGDANGSVNDAVAPRPEASAAAATATSAPPAPAVDAGGGIIRTEGSRRGDSVPSRSYTPSR